MDFGPHLLLAILEGGVTAAVLALTAMGLSIVFGVMRVVNVAHGEFYMVGAVLAWYIATALGGNPALGFVAAIIVAPLLVGSLAAGVDRLILRRINYDPERTIVATIGTLYILQQTTLMTFGPNPRPVEPPFNTRIALPWFEWSDKGLEFYYPWGLSITSYKLFVIVAASVILITLWLAITRSKAGLIMRATQQDSDMAQAFGIPVKTVYSVVFGLGAGLAAVGAVLVVPIQQAYYLMGHDPLLLAFIVVIIGGLGSLPGTIIAAILIGMADSIISVFFTPTLAKIFATLLVATVLVFRPTGLMGKSTA
ncbi:branched-chain amino acid ABC transporter permease [Amylibacter sp. IMCC11727]|uniref:branched-chain amino acid ABC transporter permease n=1 Tax=Amylibacter sp. IMCC11727 TaxID=3039851 RepID=UPI00244DFA1C|nr:branched-chain amino acid ABC transporter permease [Amylibacter sp. IMCC11727]WGI23069.1 branched-chain amino acid ABC transporter permease [Amylibacter sp. IMCC11727]